MNSFKNHLDMSAQNRTLKEISNKESLIVFGSGVPIDSSAAETIANHKKSILSLLLGLIKEADAKGDQHRTRSYWNAHHCCAKALLVEENLHFIYCKTRICITCRMNRAAKEIDKYLPVLTEWVAPYLVTLTIPAVTRVALKIEIDEMIKTFQRVTEVCRKRQGKNKRVRLVGLRSLECGYRADSDTFNPHFHIIIQDKGMAELLIAEWNLRVKERFGKDIRTDKQAIKKGDTLNVLKYLLKIFPKEFLDVNPQSEDAEDTYSAIDDILCALAGRKLFVRFGFNTVVNESKIETAKRINDPTILNFDGNKWV